ncbi:MAG: rubrerythrin family protein [Actinomycetia bacterium]|nr:rubrerythrin family protein [Actinomycetes bacterium]
MQSHARIWTGLALGVSAAVLISTPAMAFAAPRSKAPAPVSTTSQTHANLSTAMHGEAFAYAQYTAFGELAQTKGKSSSLTKLYTNTAAIELGEHFAEEAALYGLVGTTAQNLKNAGDGETYENTSMYPGYAKAAEAAGELEAADLLWEISSDEGYHAANYAAILAALNGGAKEPQLKAMVNGFLKQNALMPDITAPVAGPSQVADPTTRDNILAAMHGEAFAYASYSAYADAAQKAGYPSIATLFRATAKVEFYEHWREEANMVGLFGSAADNLWTSITGENYETTIMYPGFAATARAEGYLNAEEVFLDAAWDEAGHKAAFTKALNALG